MTYIFFHVSYYFFKPLNISGNGKIRKIDVSWENTSLSFYFSLKKSKFVWNKTVSIIIKKSKDKSLRKCYGARGHRKEIPDRVQNQSDCSKFVTVPSWEKKFPRLLPGFLGYQSCTGFSELVPAPSTQNDFMYSQS